MTFCGPAIASYFAKLVTFLIMQLFPSFAVFKHILLPKGDMTYSHSGPPRSFNCFHWMLQTAEKSEAAVPVNTLGYQYSYLRRYSDILLRNGIRATASILVGQITAGSVHVFAFAPDRSGSLRTLRIPSEQGKLPYHKWRSA